MIDGFYRFARGLVHGIFGALYRVRYHGLENIPQGGGYVLCSNHISQKDPIFIALKVPGQICYMAKAELFKFKPLGFIISHLGTFPVERGKGDTGAIDAAGERIRQGKILGIFPEGTRSKDGKLQRFKSGAIVVAAQTGADILPVIVSGPKKLKIFTRVDVTYGKMIKNSDLGLTDIHAPSQLRAAKKVLTEQMQALWESAQ